MFRIDRNQSIFITRGDTAELDVRVFNKGWHMKEQPSGVHRFKFYPLLPMIEEVKIEDSEGIHYEYEFVFDSEGYPVYPVDSEGRPIWYDPKMPLPRDSEGKLIIDPSNIFPKELPVIKRFDWPRWRQIEEVLHRWDRVTLTVKDLNGEVVLEKFNDEFPNTIFLDKEDTIDLDPKVYMYQLSYEPEANRSIVEEHPEMQEMNTMITGLFEIVDKF